MTCVAFLLATLAATCDRAFAGAIPRTVTLAPNLAELACAAGGCDRLVGVSALSDFPPQVRALPQVGDAFAINPERILDLKPDLVLAWDGGTPSSAIERLRRLGLNVQTVTTATLDDVADALQVVGGLLGTPAEATAAAERYRARLGALRKRWKDASPIRVVFQIETAPAYTVNARSAISSAISLCGGVNVFADLPTLSGTVSPEAMLAAAPQVVLYGGDENAAAMQAYWEPLGKAGANKRKLYAVNSDWLGRAGPRLLDGVEEVCGKLEEARRSAS